MSDIEVRKLIERCGIPCVEPVSAESLHRECFCLAVDPGDIRARLGEVMKAHGAAELLDESHAHLFAALPIFVPEASIEAMARVVAIIEQVAATETYQHAVQAWAPEIAGFLPGSPGGLLGFDFHLGPDGPRLIEINTNPGGILLNVLLAQAQTLCMPQLSVPAVPGHDVERATLDVLVAEWRAQGDAPQSGLVAIVDETPEQQYLYPEFILFQALLEKHGFEAVICAPQALAYADGALSIGGRRIGFVYNRCTDFALQDPASAALRSAYLDRAVAISPHPRAHALYADKRNLGLLGDRAFLISTGLPIADVDLLAAAVPTTLSLTDANREALWSQRKSLFFKPAGGFGSKASYRGDKLTHKTWEQMGQGEYVAQALVPPSQRHLAPGDTPLKLDIRCYAYRGEPLLFAARTYQGQTTNFRTPGGGFAPVLTLLDGRR